MLAISKNVLFPGHNHLLTTSTDDPTLWLSPLRNMGMWPLHFNAAPVHPISPRHLLIHHCDPWPIHTNLQQKRNSLAFSWILGFPWLKKKKFPDFPLTMGWINYIQIIVATVSLVPNTATRCTAILLQEQDPICCWCLQYLHRLRLSCLFLHQVATL